MTFTRNSLRNFLAYAKSTLDQAINERINVNIVIGNESADLDSITSSITFAYFQSLKKTSKTLYIPVLNLWKDDLRIRPELQALLPCANITEQHLLTLDDITTRPESQFRLLPGHTRWVLVDHNSLQGNLGELYGACVVGCVDHHHDEKRISCTDPNEPFVIETSGSCQSLVIDYLRDTWDSLGTSASVQPSSVSGKDRDVHFGNASPYLAWDSEIAKFALASILIDTQALTDKSKVTDYDTRAVQYLQSKIYSESSGQHSAFDTRELFDSINMAKSDISGLNIADIIRKDYKQWEDDGHRIGIAVVNRSLEYLIQKANGAQDNRSKADGLMNALKNHVSKLDLSVLTIMTAYNSSEGAFQRQLLIHTRGSEFKQFRNNFEIASLAELALEVIDLGFSDSTTTVYQQLDVTKSRKQVGPLLRKALKS